MALAIRLSRGGRKARPFYRIVVADKRMARDGRYIERLGTYNPLLANDDEKRVQLVEDRIKYWLDQGAQPSERVALFLGKAGLIDMPKQPNRPNKSAPGEKAKMRVEEKEEKRKAAEEAAKAAEEEAKAAAAEAAAAPAEEAPAEEASTEEASASSDETVNVSPAEEATQEEVQKEAAEAEENAEEEQKKEGE
ncbi:MAG: 30S ribosomal protein S16 [Alphaproteobacteria bacterium]